MSMKAEKSPEEIAMAEKSDKLDKEYEDACKVVTEAKDKEGVLSKLMQFNNPKFLLILGVFMTIPSSLANPVCGIAFAKILTLLSLPIPYLKFVDPLGVGGIEYMK